MDRRTFIRAIGGGLLAAPLMAETQQPQAKAARIGFLGFGSPSGWGLKRVEVLRGALRDLGYTEGKNFVIELRWADGNPDRLPDLAAELVRLKVDVLVTDGVTGTQAAKQATTTIPIVMGAVGDPVATGLVVSLAHPGGNITGSAKFDPELAAKRLELLKEAMPLITQVAVLMNPVSLQKAPILEAMEVAAKSLKVELQPFEAQYPTQFEGAFSTMHNRRVDAVVISEDPMLNANTGAIADLAAKQRLASIGFREFAEAGGVIGYGVNLLEMWRRAAYFVDRILKGAKPGDLPIERATRFELVINLKTTKALGLTIPQSLLLRADEVIQ